MATHFAVMMAILCTCLLGSTYSSYMGRAVMSTFLHYNLVRAVLW